MEHSQTTRKLVAVAIVVGVLAVMAVMASGVAGRDVPPSPSPSTPVTTPSPVPSESPGESPSTPPVVSPSPTPQGDAAIDLDIATDHDVSVVIDDQAGRIVDARSGQAGDGMSVRWFDVAVENIDPSTLRVTWVGLPQDDVVKLSVSEDDGKVRLGIVQSAPPVDSDAIGFDRVLILTFDEPVRAADVLTSVKTGTGTQD